MNSDVMMNFFSIAIGTFGGILVSSKLVNYRLEQLEKKVDKHNSVIERMFILEAQMKVCQADIKELEKE